MTRAEALADLRRAFAAAGLPTPELDARFLLLGGLRVTPAELALAPGAPLAAGERERLAGYRDRRLAREPVARILGAWEFWGLPFDLSADTLVPRPETETLVETALAFEPDQAAPLRLLDLGTGSGCLLVALLHERPCATGLGIDRSEAALATARLNARRNGVAARALFAASDWAAAVAGPFDLVVSNPPYIATPVLASLEPEVREHDPARALDGGPDGLDAYRAILAAAPRLLRPGGHLVVEIGYDQAEALRRLAGAAPLEFLRLAPDLSGNPRCVAFRRT